LRPPGNNRPGLVVSTEVPHLRHETAHTASTITRGRDCLKKGSWIPGSDKTGRDRPRASAKRSADVRTGNGPSYLSLLARGARCFRTGGNATWRACFGEPSGEPTCADMRLRPAASGTTLMAVTRQLAVPGDDWLRSGPPSHRGGQGSNPLSSTQFQQVTSSQYELVACLGSLVGSRVAASQPVRSRPSHGQPWESVAEANAPENQCVLTGGFPVGSRS
jgi:hypothetical protein